MKPLYPVVVLALGVAIGLAPFGDARGAGRQEGIARTETREQRPPRARWKLAVRLLAVGAAGYVAVAIALVALEDRFVYQPTAGSPFGWDPPHLGVEECWFRTGDGLRLHGWWRPPETDEGPVLLWCHGNAGNISHRAENLELVARRGLGALLFDYRGYGRSDGKPSEEGLYEDAEAAHRWLTEEKGVPPGRIVCFGRSLGAAVALRTACQRPVAGLVMESPFVSVPAMARHMMPLVPVWGLARNEFDSLALMAGLGVPVFMIHGTADELVPPEQGRRLYQAAPEPKEWYAIEGAGHNDTYIIGGEQYLDKFEAFCRRCVRTQAE